MKDIQEEHILILAKHGQPVFTNTFFPYTSGEIGPYFIECVAIEDDGIDYHNAVNALCCLIRKTSEDYDSISGGESKDWDFSNPVAYNLVKPHIKLYKERENLGAKIQGKRIIHVADINNEGSSVRDRWYPNIKSNGGILSQVYFYVDRMEDGVKVIKELGLKSYSVVSLDKRAWQILLDNNVITVDTYKSLNRRMEDKRSWAHDTLRKNIQKLGDMLNDNLARPKAEKIINNGYPEIKEELIDRLLKNGYKY